MAEEPETDPLDRLEVVAAVVDEVERERREAIVAARAAGYTWARIGAALGITGQAAGRLARRRDLPDPRPETRAQRRERLAAAHGALLIRVMGLAQATEWFPDFYGRPLPEAAHAADPDDLPPGYARRRSPRG